MIRDDAEYILSIAFHESLCTEPLRTFTKQRWENSSLPSKGETMSPKSAEPSPVKCPICGSTQISDTTIDSEFSVTGGTILDTGQFIGTIGPGITGPSWVNSIVFEGTTISSGDAIIGFLPTTPPSAISTPTVTPADRREFR